MPDLVEHRILAALKLVDAVTQLPLNRKLDIQPAQLRLSPPEKGEVSLIYKTGGVVIVRDAPGFFLYTHSFLPGPDDPVLSSRRLDLNIFDPELKYLPRVLHLDLPRRPTFGQPDSVFDPLAVALFPAPAARTELSWALVRACVRPAASPDERLPWALVRVLKHADDSLLAVGQADARGEILLVAPGLLFAMPSESAAATLTKTIEVHFETRFDPNLARIKDKDLREGRAVIDARYIPDPATLAVGPPHATTLKTGAAPLSATGSLAAGQTLSGDLLVAG